MKFHNLAVTNAKLHHNDVESIDENFRMFLNPFGVFLGSSSSRKMRLLTEIEAKMKVRSSHSILVHVRYNMM